MANGRNRASCSPNSRTFAPNDLEQFRAGSKQVILWPAEYKTGNMIYPYSEARKN
jgi:hypothetical protein